MKRTVTRVTEPVKHNGRYYENCIIEVQEHPDGGIDTIVRNYEDDVCLDCFHAGNDCSNCTIDGKPA